MAYIALFSPTSVTFVIPIFCNGMIKVGKKCFAHLGICICNTF